MFLETELPSGARGFAGLVMLSQAFLSGRPPKGSGRWEEVREDCDEILCDACVTAVLWEHVALEEGLRPASCWPPRSHTDHSAAGRGGLFLFSFAGRTEQVKGIRSVCWR